MIRRPEGPKGVHLLLDALLGICLWEAREPLCLSLFRPTEVKSEEQPLFVLQGSVCSEGLNE